MVRADCMRDVCYAGRYWYADISCAGIVCAMQCMLCGTGRRDGVQMQGMRYGLHTGNIGNLVAMVAGQILASEACKTMKNGRRSLQNRGIVDILYDGFRKCFVNCKFTFYITLSSYLKKVKIRKTRKRHRKM